MILFSLHSTPLIYPFIPLFTYHHFLSPPCLFTFSLAYTFPLTSPILSFPLSLFLSLLPSSLNETYQLNQINSSDTNSLSDKFAWLFCIYLTWSISSISNHTWSLDYSFKLRTTFITTVLKSNFIPFKLTKGKIKFLQSRLTEYTNHT